MEEVPWLINSSLGNNRILIHPSNEIMVAGVRAMVHDAMGQLREAGDAVEQVPESFCGVGQPSGRMFEV